MTKELKYILVVLFAMLSFTGCGPIGQKATSMAVIYGVTAIVSILLLCIYCVVVKNKNPWMLMLYSAIIVVEIGYVTLAMSETLEEALLSNRIAYLGSVFLPMTMLMMIVDICKIKYKKWIPFLLMFVGVVVFVIAASPGYSDIYYKEVVLKTENGVAILDKTYGPLHSIYLYYLVLYFAAMVVSIIYACAKKIESTLQAVILAGAVLGNLGVWLLEQLVKIDFEILSVSYIVSEFFLLTLSLMVQQQNNENAVEESKPEKVEEKTEEEPIEEEQTKEEQPEKDALVALEEEHIQVTDEFAKGIKELTHTERKVFDMYVGDMTSAQIMEELHITNNTLKFHNKNIYSKLNVNSRKQLMEMGKEYNNSK